MFAEKYMPFFPVQDKCKPLAETNTFLRTSFKSISYSRILIAGTYEKHLSTGFQNVSMSIYLLNILWTFHIKIKVLNKE